MAPQPPPYGQGPVNYTDPRYNGGPDSQIDYQAMMRYQAVTQYQQQQPTQYNMPRQMQRQVLTDPRFSYGVQGGQDPSYYNRQADLNRSAYAGAVTSGVLGAASWSATAAPLAAMGFAGASVIVPAMALTAPIMATIGNRVNENLDRQKFMHSIAMDLQQNRMRLGMGSLSYGQATSAGASMADMFMNDKGKFFDRNQMMRINKIGLSEGMLDNSGSLSSYKKNVGDLIKATEDIVKTLQTTIEGGMSIIKEVNGIGFKTLPQVQAQIRAARAGGMSTGLGMQNMLQIGAAGAQAVQGTPWNAAVGASMFQMGAVNANAIASASPRGAYAVERVGGVAQAGALIAGAQMNMMQSGIGKRYAAYAMNADGSMNEGKLQELLSGRVSAVNIVRGANRTGQAMGSNRVRFDMFAADMWNGLSDVERGGMTRDMFNKWREKRGGGGLNQAYVFAGQFSNDPNTQRLVYESLTGPNGLRKLEATSRAQDFMSADMRASSAPRGWLVRAAGAIGGGMRQGINAVTDYTMAGIGGAGSLMGAGASYVGGIGFNVGNQMLMPFGGDRYGMMNRPINYGDMQRAAMLGTGAIGPTDLGGKIRMAERLTGGFSNLGALNPMMKVTNFLDNAMLKNANPQELQMALVKLNSAIKNGRVEDLNKDNNLARALSLEPGTKFSVQKAASMIHQISAIPKSIAKELDDVTGRYEKDGVFGMPEFKSDYENAVYAIKTRGPGQSAEDALAEYRRSRGTNDTYDAGKYVDLQLKAKSFANMTTINADVVDVAGRRAGAVRASRRYAKGYGVVRAVGNFARGAANVIGGGQATGLKKMVSSIGGWAQSQFDSQGAQFYDTLSSAKSKMNLGNLDRISKEEQRALDLEKGDESIQRGYEEYQKSGVGELQNYFATLAQGKGFTGTDIMAAMKSGESLKSFISNNAKGLGYDADIMTARVMEGKDDDARRMNFVRFLTGGESIKEATHWEKKRVIDAQFEGLKSERERLLTGEGRKKNNKEIEKINSAMAAMGTDYQKLMLDQMSLNQNGTGKSGNSASVSTPILNYWNNRWVL